MGLQYAVWQTKWTELINKIQINFGFSSINIMIFTRNFRTPPMHTWDIGSSVMLHSYLSTFREKVQVPSSRVKFLLLKMGPTGYPETSVHNYQYKLCNIPTERRFKKTNFCHITQNLNCLKQISVTELSDVSVPGIKLTLPSNWVV
jgi:hypothetical protein